MPYTTAQHVETAFAILTDLKATVIDNGLDGGYEGTTAHAFADDTRPYIMQATFHITCARPAFNPYGDWADDTLYNRLAGAGQDMEMASAYLQPIGLDVALAGPLNKIVTRAIVALWEAKELLAEATA